MKTLLLVIFLCACGGTEKNSDPDAVATVEDVALRWGRAALGGNRAEAIALSLTHTELSAISNKSIEKADYDEELASVIDGMAREGRENPTGKVVSAKVAQRKTLPAGEKVKREIEIAAVVLVVEDKGEKHEGMPMFFVHLDAGWRFTPRK